MPPGSLVVLVVLAVIPNSTAQSWVRARSAHAEVLCDGTDVQARRAAERVEGAHRTLAALFPAVREVDAAPPVVLAFMDPRAFSRFVPLRGLQPQRVDGVILGAVDRTYIVASLGGERENPFDILAHESTHHVLNAALPAQPAWLGEGVAELIANAAVGPVAAAVGRVHAAHLDRLAHGRPMPLRALLAVGYLSPIYQGGEGREMFYAQSWALAHWIVAGGHGGAAGLLGYARAIGEGEDPGPAFARSFGMTVEAAEASLAAYVAAAPLPLVVLPLAAASRAPVEIDVPAPAEVDRHLADVLVRAGRGKEQEELVARAEAASAADPSGPRALLARVRQQLSAISARGAVPSDAEEGRAADLLERAVAADPDLADAADLLARLRPAPIARRIALLRRAVARQPERAELAFTLAGLHVKRNDYAEAARVLRRAKERTRDDAHRFLADHLLGKIGSVSGGVAEARGTVEAVECLAGGALAFRVRTASGFLRLSADSPRALFLYDEEGETMERDLTCGPAAWPVTARYVAGPPGTETHRLLSLSFHRAR